MKDLTVKQNEILDCIKKYISDHGYPPTVREICKIKNYSSPSTVQKYIDVLIEKGFIKKDKIKNRSIELLVDNEYLNKSTINIPLLNKNDFIELPISLVHKNKEIYGYIVSDDSLVCNHIINNDILIIERSKSFSDNDIIVYMDDADIVIGKLSDSNKNIIGKVIGLYRKMWKNKGNPCFYICFPFTTLLLYDLVAIILSTSVLASAI